MTGVELIEQERQRQIEVEGWTPEHDAGHSDGELAEAAACYAISANDIANHPDESRRHTPEAWPWSRTWWKPTSRIRDLTKAGALIAAEIDRLQSQPDEQTASQPNEHDPKEEL